MDFANDFMNDSSDGFRGQSASKKICSLFYTLPGNTYLIVIINYLAFFANRDPFFWDFALMAYSGRFSGIIRIEIQIATGINGNMAYGGGENAMNELMWLKRLSALQEFLER